VTTLIIAIAGFFAGFVDSVVGGGGMISLPTFLALGLPPTLALGTNKVVGISTAIASSACYGASRSINWKVVIPTACFGVMASAIGAFTATVTDPTVLRPIILIGLFLVATYLLFKNRFGLQERPKKLHHPFWGILLGVGVGFYDGFFGPGTGTFLMMAFVGLFGEELLRASANSRLINFATNLGALMLFASRGQVHFSYALPGAIAAFVGGLCGATWAIRKGSKAIRPVFIIAVWALMIKLVWDLWK